MAEPRDYDTWVWLLAIAARAEEPRRWDTTDDAWSYLLALEERCGPCYVDALLILFSHGLTLSQAERTLHRFDW